MLLAGAIVTEVAATLSLRASQDHSAWLVLVAVGYVGAFVLLTMVLRTGMPVGVAYGIWGALGTAGTAVLAALLFGDPFTWPIVAGIGLIIAGVLLVEFGSHRGRGRRVVMWWALAGAILIRGVRDAVDSALPTASATGPGSHPSSRATWCRSICCGCRWDWACRSASPTACGPRAGSRWWRSSPAVLFDEPLTWVMVLGIGLIMAGVLTIELVGVAH